MRRCVLVQAHPKMISLLPKNFLKIDPLLTGHQIEAIPHDRKNPLFVMLNVPLLTGHQIEAIPLFVMLSIHLLLALIFREKSKKVIPYLTVTEVY